VTGDDTPTGGTSGTSSGGTGAVTYGIPGPSCDSLRGTECQGESCCTSILVPGGTFMMVLTPVGPGPTCADLSGTRV
ncbi:MAG TPA: hypothetical protein PLS95_13500, partial [Thermoanaerobaculales bacterium]|nr:hypothetical protein [Thermoanaerobaculales bacterium]